LPVFLVCYFQEGDMTLKPSLSPKSEGAQIQSEIKTLQARIEYLKQRYQQLQSLERTKRSAKHISSPSDRERAIKALLPTKSKKQRIGELKEGTRMETVAKCDKETSLEPFSQLRMDKVRFDPALFADRMKNRRFIGIDQIETNLIDGDIEGDWVTIGIISGIQTIKTQDRQLLAVLTDLSQNYVRLAIPAGFEVEPNDIIAILNAQVICPSQVFCP
jgi:hypothetical protein